MFIYSVFPHVGGLSGLDKILAHLRLNNKPIYYHFKNHKIVLFTIKIEDKNEYKNFTFRERTTQKLLQYYF